MKPSRLVLKHAAAAISFVLLWPATAFAQDDEYVHLVRQGETLEAIARTLVGDGRQWSRLQQINHVRNPRRIPVGTALRIPVDLMHLGRGTAKVAYLAGTVLADGVALALGRMLPEGVLITTADNGFVTLSLPDNSRVAVPPNSSIKLDFLKQSDRLPLVRSQISLERGRVESHVIPDGSSAPRLKIRTRQAVVGVRGTVFRVAAEERGATRAEVIAGSVRASSNDAPSAVQVVATGYGLVVDGGPPRLEALSMAPDLSAVPAIQTRPILRIPLPEVAGATAFRVAVSTEEGNRTPFAEDIFALGKEAKFAGIPDGEYWLNVRAIAASGLEGKDAVRKIQMAAQPEPPFLMHPASGARLPAANLAFQWTQAKDIDRYRFELSTDPEFPAALTDARELATTTHTTPAALAPQRYYWRVASIMASGKQGPFSDPQTFSILAPRAALTPPTESNGKLKFNWNHETGQHHQFQLARDEAFHDLVSEAELAVSEAYVPIPPGGTYYVRTRALDADGFVGPYTPVQRIDIPASFPWWIFAPLIFML